MSIQTELTKMLHIKYPIIGAPMFLVTNEKMVTEISEAGGIGTIPTLNFRTEEAFKTALMNMKQSTKKPIGVNIIVNKSNIRAEPDLKSALDAGVELFITSLGSPKKVIDDAHKNGAKVICDVINLEQALKVQDLGADAVIAVASGAGGHAGPISPLVLVSWLKQKIQIPIIAAGGIADGPSMASMLILGAAGVSVGTRFIASTEAQIDNAYKQAVVSATPEDIVMTTRISGTPASVINTEYIQKLGLHLPWYLKILKDQKLTKKYIVPLIHWMGSKALSEAAAKPTWKTVWSAGQSVGLIHDILPCKMIIENMVNDYKKAYENLPR